MALPRFHTPLPALLEHSTQLRLTDAAVRHMQVLRLQPGDAVVLFDDGDHEWICRITEMDRKSAVVQAEHRIATQREIRIGVQLALGMPANDRMDAVIEKATELGAASVQPLVCQRSVLRLEGERAAKRTAHWSSVALSSTEQCGRTKPMRVEAVAVLATWLAKLSPHASGAGAHIGFVLSTGDAPHLSLLLPRYLEPAGAAHVVLLSGPEGGLSLEEETAATDAGFVRASLGPRILRADTAPLAALTLIAAYCDSTPCRSD